VVIDEVACLCLGLGDGWLEAGDALPPPPRVPILQFDEETLLFHLNRNALIHSTHFEHAFDLHKGPELGVVVLHKDSAVAVESKGSLGSAHRNIRNSYVIIDPPANRVLFFKVKVDDMYGLAKAVDVGLKHHVFFFIRNFEVQKEVLFYVLLSCALHS